MRMQPTRPAPLVQPPSRSECRDPTTEGVLSARRGRPARTPFGFLVSALPVVVPASECGVCCPSLVGPCICWRVGGTSDVPFEALFPQGGGGIELASSGWSRVLGIDAVGGPPQCEFTNEGGARVAPGGAPVWWGVTLAGVVVDLVGEVGDEFGSLGQVDPQKGWSWSVDGMPGSQGSGPGLVGVSAGRRQ
jgi:hypothetical protein